MRPTEPAEHGSLNDSTRLTREQVVDRIVTINPTATGAFLGRFSTGELRTYLRRLQLLRTSDRRGGAWPRTDSHPAIVTRRPRGW